MYYVYLRGNRSSLDEQIELRFPGSAASEVNGTLFSKIYVINKSFKMI